MISDKTKHLQDIIKYKKAIISYSDMPSLNEFYKDLFFTEDNIDRNIISMYSIPEKKGYITELEHITAVLVWVSENIKHDGYTKYRSHMNIIDLLKYSIDKKQGVNCLMNAIITQEILYIMGYKAHIIQCNPYDYTILDCHWLVNIFLNEYNKWAIFDPVWCNYCINDKGLPMSAFDIRDAISKDKTIIFSKTLKNDFYYYLLCRYFFLFGFFSLNGIGTFDKNNQQKIYLSPTGFDSRNYLLNREKLKFLPFDINEYLFFSRHEQNSKHYSF